MSLVRAMEAGAQCVLLDEPFTGLDEENRKKAIEDEWNALEMISFDIEHLTGKIGLEVLAERNENR